MSIQNVRYVLWGMFFFLLFILFNTWENDKVLTDKLILNDKSDYSNISDLSNESKNNTIYNKKNELFIDTKLINAKIDLYGGDITHLSLKKHNDVKEDLNEGVTVFNKYNNKFYFPQSGFFNEHKYNITDIKQAVYLSKTINHNIKYDGSNLLVSLEYYINNDISVNKIYTFRNYSYEIDIDFYVYNNGKNIYSGRMYGLMEQKNNVTNNGIFGSSMKTYEGGALYTDFNSYKKMSFNDITDKNNLYVINGGWFAFLEHYFLSIWMPDFSHNYVYTVEKEINDKYVLKYVSKDGVVIFPGECKCIDSRLFVGPKVKYFLNKLYKGLDLTIDYGIFWPISGSIFLLLDKVFIFVKNWGISIILITLIIKLLFFHLSSISYMSVGNIKKLQPRLTILKERYKDNKKQFGESMIDLYKKEKINPLSGCFPVLFQIPVFISLYYVLLESVELKHAEFFFWICDLSNKDMYYILPIVMCLTTFIQQKFNPPVQDPMQAKIMMFMPIILLLVFLQFPSGLILYWIINNILSICQQWVIIKKVNV